MTTSVYNYSSPNKRMTYVYDGNPAQSYSSDSFIQFNDGVEGTVGNGASNDCNTSSCVTASGKLMTLIYDILPADTITSATFNMITTLILERDPSNPPNYCYGGPCPSPTAVGNGSNILDISASTFKITLKRIITGAWTEAVTWNDKPTDLENIKTVTEDGLISIDVTEAVKKWHSGVWANNGFIVVADGFVRCDKFGGFMWQWDPACGQFVQAPRFGNISLIIEHDLHRELPEDPCINAITGISYNIFSDEFECCMPDPTNGAYLNSGTNAFHTVIGDKIEEFKNGSTDISYLVGDEPCPSFPNTNNKKTRLVDFKTEIDNRSQTSVLPDLYAKFIGGLAFKSKGDRGKYIVVDKSTVKLPDGQIVPVQGSTSSAPQSVKIDPITKLVDLKDSLTVDEKCIFQKYMDAVQECLKDRLIESHEVLNDDTLYGRWEALLEASYCLCPEKFQICCTDCIPSGETNT